MPKIACHVIVAAGLLLGGARLSAEDVPPAAPAPPVTPAAIGKPTAPPASTASASGKAGATAITSGLPRYNPPPKPAPKKTSADVEGEDEAEPEDRPLAPDQPRNKIIRLPRYIVEGDRPPVFRERDIYTKQALAAIAMRRYLSGLDRSLLSRYTLPLFGTSPESRAMAMYEEDARLQNISDLKKSAANARLAGDKADSDYILRETNSTFLRSGGMDWNSWSK
ncbi:MAG TPA: hypothetical protein VMC06_01135 [Opitutaceae bacterium]|nr:hypothetical protein [Opitutaceae bacterium]